MPPRGRKKSYRFKLNLEDFFSSGALWVTGCNCSSPICIVFDREAVLPSALSVFVLTCTGGTQHVRGEYRGCDVSYSSRNRCDMGYFFPDIFVVHISAEGSVFQYVDSDIRYHRSFGDHIGGDMVCPSDRSYYYLCFATSVRQIFVREWQIVTVAFCPSISMESGFPTTMLLPMTVTLFPWSSIP